ncbi:filamentous hemagglutinin N-terminal domain-containing protein [Chroococcus sp. FPU101]|uniref:two-partner secretion domain-containing protein n=1 Tax=Chroococcus sp. FPU101 TaxID=1974212 RepID=UPI001A8F9150|nr:filamentous hemagglutinin N-terminal domain-containing protein [Chroococcus sp. FPU101]GFE69086.1 haemagglutination activity domain protein [Chroococcus sp. FPU101]
MQFNKLIILFIISITITPLSAVKGQIVPDQTLGNESSIVVPEQIIKELPSSVIQGGASRGTNLFHSFHEFNIDLGKAVYFNNPLGINSIFTRITGNKASQLLGRLGVLGNANLLLLNPNGIIFGRNASLDVNGSFVATTANRIRFADRTLFSSNNNSLESILTISVPIGLDFFGNNQPIRVEGYGHNVNLRAFLPAQRFPTLSFLSVPTSKTLALIGGNVTLSGGVVQASGHIEVASVDQGFVKWSGFSESNNFSYQEVQKFKNVDLTSASLLDASGSFNGQINISANQLTLQGGSGILSQQVMGEKSQIYLSLSALNINGGLTLKTLVTPENYPIILPIFTSQGRTVKIGDVITSFFPNFILSEVLAQGQGTAITINTENLKISDGGQITTRTFGEATGGQIIIKAQNVQILGYANIPEFISIGQAIFSSINTSTFAQGNGGLISLSSNDLFIEQGGSLSSTTFAFGKGGNINLKVNNLISLSGIIPNVFLQSSIKVVSTGQATGNAGDLTLQTTKLKLSNGGEISNSTYTQSNAGSSFISASESITLDGVADQDSRFPSTISSAGYTTTQNLRDFFSIAPLPTGNAGRLTITTPQLTISNGAVISVGNNGLGDAGQINIKTKNLQLDQGNITAATRTGKQGNINIISDLTRLSNNSSISAIAGTTSDGGNIFLNSSLLLIDGSQITADAIQGNGGNIDLRTLVIFKTLDSSITASSRLGIDGTINIDTIPYNFDVTNVEIPTSVSLAQVALKACYDYGQRLTQTGEGQIVRDVNRAGRTFDDLIPLNQAISIENLPDGRVRLLTCQDILKTKLPQNRE